MCLIPFRPLVPLSTPTPPLVYLVFCFNNNLPRYRKWLFGQLFSNSLRHCKDQGIRQPSWSPDKARTEFYAWQERKAHHSQQSAQHSHPSSQTKQQQSAAKQASKHPLSFCCLTTTCWGGPWLDLLDYGACLAKEGCLGWVPDLLVLHSVGKRLVSFLDRTGRLGRSGRRTEVVLVDNTGLEEVRIAVAVELSASSFLQTSRPAREIYWITLGWTVAASILSAHILTPPPPPPPPPPPLLLLLESLKRVAGMPWRQRQGRSAPLGWVLMLIVITAQKASALILRADVAICCGMNQPLARHCDSCFCMFDTRMFMVGKCLWASGKGLV
jgi:hypothetical protein